MSQRADGAKKADPIILKLSEDWKAYRTADGEWYFNQRSTKTTTWDLPPPAPGGAALLEPYTSNGDLDRRWQLEHAGAPLPAAADRVQKASQLKQRAKALRARYVHFADVELAPPPRDTAWVGPGTWTHAAGAGNISSDSALLRAIAVALAASYPSCFHGQSHLEGQWHRLMLSGLGPDAMLRPEIRQMLAAAPEEFLQSPSARQAIAEVLSSGFSAHAGLVSVLVSLWDLYVLKAGLHAAAAAAVGELVAPAAGGSSAASVPIASGAAGAGAGAGAAAGSTQYGGRGLGAASSKRRRVGVIMDDEDEEEEDAGSSFAAAAGAGDVSAAAQGSGAAGSRAGGMSIGALSLAADAGAGGLLGGGGAGGSAGGTAAAPLESGEDIAVGKLVSLFRQAYSPEVGLGLLAALPAGSAEWGEDSTDVAPQQYQGVGASGGGDAGGEGEEGWLVASLTALFGHPAWRACLVELSEGDREDPFLRRAVQLMARRGYHNAVVSASAMAASLGTHLRVLREALAAAALPFNGGLLRPFDASPPSLRDAQATLSSSGGGGAAASQPAPIRGSRGWPLEQAWGAGWLLDSAAASLHDRRLSVRRLGSQDYTALFAAYALRAAVGHALSQRYAPQALRAQARRRAVAKAAADAAAAAAGAAAAPKPVRRLRLTTSASASSSSSSAPIVIDDGEDGGDAGDAAHGGSGAPAVLEAASCTAAALRLSRFRQDVGIDALIRHNAGAAAAAAAAAAGDHSAAGGGGSLAASSSVGARAMSVAPVHPRLAGGIPTLLHPHGDEVAMDGSGSSVGAGGEPEVVLRSALPGVLEALQALRALCLRHFAALRGELFPDEGWPFAAAAADEACRGVVNLAERAKPKEERPFGGTMIGSASGGEGGDGSGGGAANGSVASFAAASNGAGATGWAVDSAGAGGDGSSGGVPLSDRRRAAMLSAPASRAEVRAFLLGLGAASDYLLDDATLNTLQQLRGEVAGRVAAAAAEAAAAGAAFEAAAAAALGGGDGGYGGEAADAAAHAEAAAAAAAAAASEHRQELETVDIALTAAASVGQVLSQPDVLAFLLHLLFHPEIAFDAALCQGTPVVQAAAALQQEQAAAARAQGGGGGGDRYDAESDTLRDHHFAEAAAQQLAGALAWALWNAQTGRCSNALRAARRAPGSGGVGSAVDILLAGGAALAGDASGTGGGPSTAAAAVSGGATGAAAEEGRTEEEEAAAAGADAEGLAADIASCVSQGIPGADAANLTCHALPRALIFAPLVGLSSLASSSAPSSASRGPSATAGAADAGAGALSVSSAAAETGGAGSGSGSESALCAAGHAAYVASLASSLVECSRLCKGGGPLYPVTSIASSGFIAGFGGGVSRAASGVGGGPSGPALTPAQALATLLLRGVGHPALSLGALHWARHALLHPSLSDDPRLLPAAAVLTRFGLAIADACPLQSVNVLALLRQLLAASNSVADAGAVMAHREACVAAMGDLLLAGSCVMPTLSYLRLQAASGGWDAALLRRAATHLLRGVSLPLSPAFALELVRTFHATQARVARAAEAEGGGAGGGGSSGAFGGGGSAAGGLSRSSSNASLSASGGPGGAAANSITFGMRGPLQDLLERLYKDFATAQGDHTAALRAGEAPPPDPTSGAPAEAAFAARQEVLRLIADMNDAYKRSGVL